MVFVIQYSNHAVPKSFWTPADKLPFRSIFQTLLLVCLGSWTWSPWFCAIPKLFRLSVIWKSKPYNVQQSDMYSPQINVQQKFHCTAIWLAFSKTQTTIKYKWKHAHTDGVEIEIAGKSTNNNKKWLSMRLWIISSTTQFPSQFTHLYLKIFIKTQRTAHQQHIAQIRARSAHCPHKTHIKI